MVDASLQSIQSTTRLFTAYAVNPKNLHFEHQEKDEKVILFLREAFITLVPAFLLAFIMVFVPPVIFPFFIKLFSPTVQIPVGYIVVGTIFWYVGTFGVLFSRLLYWFFNIFILTDQRIIDIDFINLLYKDVAETQLSRVQDISYNAKGIFATMFDYGDVMIQTAGEVPNFTFESVPKPSQVVDIISDHAKLRAKSIKE